MGKEDVGSSAWARRFPGLELAGVGWRVEGQQTTVCICSPLSLAPDPIPDLHPPAPCQAEGWALSSPEGLFGPHPPDAWRRPIPVQLLCLPESRL